ncbi:MAG: endonuclease domain-containing protein [Spirochaetes bacterium]|nr:endonuclease domain-containing protein [Spirochaetota bacterium]
MTKIFNRISEKEKRRILRNNATHAEKLIWDKLRKRQINNIRFRRQVSIGPYIVDFYCPELKLVVEIDGEYHLNIEVIEYDKNRERYLRELGIKIVRFTNDEILTGIEPVVEKIRGYC